MAPMLRLPHRLRLRQLLPNPNRHQRGPTEGRTSKSTPAASASARRCEREIAHVQTNSLVQGRRTMHFLPRGAKAERGRCRAATEGALGPATATPPPPPPPPRRPPPPPPPPPAGAAGRERG